MLKDLSFAFRTWLARPAFAAAAIATLAVGIGATTAIFSTVNAALLRPLAYPRADDLFTLSTMLTDGRYSTGLVSPAEMIALNEHAPSVAKAILVRGADNAIVTDPAQGGGTSAETVQVVIYSVSEGFFDLFALPMTLGRGFAPDDHLPPAPPQRPAPGETPPPFVPPAQLAVLSHHVWRNQFGSDPNVVGRSLQFVNTRATIVGVAAPELDIPAGADVWINLRVARQSVAHSFTGYLRVKPGTTRERLSSEMTSAMAAVAREYPSSATGRAFSVEPLVSGIVGDLGPTLVLVLSGAGLLLLLACVNVTNLLLARSAVRGREIAVRTALGAGRARIVRQLLTEALALATIGTLAGLAIAFVGVRVLQAFGASRLPRLDSIPFDGRVLLFALAVLVITAFLIGLAPAIRLARTDIRSLLNESSRSATARGGQRLLAGMAVAEIAVAITLVAGAGWLVRSFQNLWQADPGFTTEGRVVFDLFLPSARYGGPGGEAATMAIKQRLQGIGSVIAVGGTSVVPLRPERDVAYYVGTNLAPDDLNHQLTARLRNASPGFFKAMGVKVITGREFTDDDRAAPVAIVNRAFADKYLAGRDALTEQFYFGFPTVSRQRAYTIAGVVDDMRYASVGEAGEPTFYMPSFGLQRTMVVASSLKDPAGIVAGVRQAFAEIDPTITVNPELMTDIVGRSLSRQQLGVILMMLFAGAALALAAIGIYGVLAYASSQRLGEVATRMALGATPGNVFWMMMRQGRTLAVIGTVIGLLVAYLGGRIVSSRLYEVRALDPMILVTAVLLVLAITALAVFVPARRAASIDLARTLRLE